MTNSDITITAETPSQSDFRRLRLAAGLSGKTEEAAARGLPNTIFAVVAYSAGRAIGMGRVIGDGGTAFQITDIAVEPEFQGRGIGKAIVSRLVEQLKQTAPKSAYVSLIADGDAAHLYAKYGFKPTAPASIGMSLVID